MRTLLLLTILSLFFCDITAQSFKVEGFKPVFEVDTSTVVTNPDVHPVYPGGENELLWFVANNTNYPPIAKENGIQGVVYVSYVVDVDTQIKDINIVRGVDPFLDKESARVISLIKYESPGLKNGKPVPVLYTMPIRYQLTGGNNLLERTPKIILDNIAQPANTSLEDSMPKYPGGDIQLLRDIEQMIRYPKEDEKLGRSGVVRVSYVVDTTGLVKDVKIVQGVSESLDKEALRVVNSLPRFTPGYRNGKPVQVQFTIPIKFGFSYNHGSGNGKYFVRTPYLDSANVELGKFNFSQAIRLYDKSIQSEPLLRIAYYQRGLAHYALQQFKEADQDFTDALEQKYWFKTPDSRILATRAAMKYDLDDIDGAIVDLLKAREKNNENYEIDFKLGECWAKKGDLKEAKKYFRFATGSDPNNPEAFYQLAGVYVALKKYKNAIDVYEKVISLEPKSGNAYLNRGTCYARERDMEKACEDWKKAAELGSQEAETLVASQCK